MPRKTPPAPPAVARRDGLTTTRIDFEFVTPLLGGSATPHENDPHHPVRGGSVRGPLRYWWRAARAGEFADVTAMHRRESEIWGSAERAAAVTIEVTMLDPGEPSKVIKQFSSDEVPAYAAFPLPSQGAMRTVLWQAQFALTLRYPPEFERDVQAAVWAFSTFGGVGGRTRRGFGGIQEMGTELDLAQVAARLRDDAWVKQRPAPKGVPSLYGAQLVKASKAFEGPIDAWYYAVERLQEFRQHRRPGQGQRPGRSFWGEPDAIRRLRKEASPAHSEPVNHVDKYPRAVFGLPILFQFKDGREGDPSVQTLKGAGIERLASPVILRAAWVKGGAAAFAIRMANVYDSEDGLVPGGLRLNNQAVAHGLTDQEVASLKQAGFKRPLQPDVIQAFFDYFAQG